MRKREKSESEIKVIQELLAIVLIGVAALLLLALISFEPNDVPFFAAADKEATDNFIGPVGAWVAAGLVILFGVAAYMVPLVMLVGGVLLIFAPQVKWGIKLFWFLLVILTGAGLLQWLGPVVRPISGMDYPGGLVGYALHDKFLSRVIGTAGSVIVLMTTYLSSMILLFDVRPVYLIRRGWSLGVGWYEERERRRFEEADPLERLEMEQRRIEKERRKLEKKAGRKSTRNAEREDFTALDKDDTPAITRDEDIRRPEPKVFDSMAVTNQIDRNEEKTTSISSLKSPGSGVTDGAKVAPSKKASGNVVTSSESLDGLLSEDRPDYADYQLPSISILNANMNTGGGGMGEAELKEQQQLLVDTLKEFGIEVEPGDITKGATITRYEVYPAPGVRVERIAKMNKDIARAMRAESVNIIAPIPGKDTVGVEIGNPDKSMIVLRDLFESEGWRRSKARLPLALGKDVYGKVLIADLAEMPHLLIGGSTGSGKSVCINSILMSFLFRFSPEDLRLLMVDPKVVELQVYNDLPHLVVPVVTEPKKVLMALRWVINEMELRYRMMAKCGVRNISAYNARQAEEKTKKMAQAAERAAVTPQEGQGDEAAEEMLPGMSAEAVPPLPEKFPYIVVIIDELADLMATTAAEVELAISRLAAKARAAGIHLIIATQTPRAQVVTGVIKTNVPCRIAFKVPSALDSRVILDENGAENLLGKGDMLYLPPGSSKQLRAQGAFVSDEEVADVVTFIKNQTTPSFDEEIHQKLSKTSRRDDEEITEEDEENIRKAMEVALQERKLSTSLLQRRARIGYNTAARIVDLLESKGIIGAQEGAKPRELLVDPDEFDIDQFMESL
ncbi:MAG: DNA translocase FtsK [Candidatus Methylacidiphilales bacterium]